MSASAAIQALTIRSAPRVRVRATSFGLGQLLAQGLGGPKDAAKGKELIAKACAAGNQAACQAK